MKPCQVDVVILLKHCGVFVQAMSMFSSALASGQLGPLMNQFGLPSEAVDAANKGGELSHLSINIKSEFKISMTLLGKVHIFS